MRIKPPSPTLKGDDIPKAMFVAVVVSGINAACSRSLEIPTELNKLMKQSQGCAK